MANNYLEFSEIIENLTPEELRWWKNKQQEIEKAYDEDPEGACYDESMCRDFFIEEKENQIWLCAEESGDPDKIGNIVQAFFKEFRITEYFSLTWACWCSKPRLGEFGGGAMFVTADEIKFSNIDEWLRKEVEQHEKKQSDQEEE
jgi:hypothetical protein